MADRSAAFGSPTSRTCLQRTHQPGTFRQAVTVFSALLGGPGTPPSAFSEPADVAPEHAPPRRSRPTPAFAASTCGPPALADLPEEDLFSPRHLPRSNTRRLDNREASLGGSCNEVQV